MLSTTKVFSLDVSVNYACFQTKEKSYLEVYLHVFANTVSGFPEHQSGVKTFIIIKQGNEVINFENYTLSFPADSIQSNFVDMRRFGLPEGNYNLEIEMVDILDSTNTFFFKNPVEIQYEPAAFHQSDLLLLSSMQKGEPDHPLYKQGYLMEDVAFNFYHDALKSLYFYNEVYNLADMPEEMYFYTYSICEQYAGEKGKTIKEAHKRLKKNNISLIVHEINIEDLPSGNYHLKLEVKNGSKEVISLKTKNFQRSNPIFDLTIASMGEKNYDYSFVHDISADELDYNLKAIVPRLSQESSEGLYYVISNGNEQSKRYYLFRFWTNMNKDLPKMAYEQYMEVAKAVDKSFFSGFGHGFETDRGRTFLKYGKPNDLISVEEEPSAPPYEIWIYNSIPETEQTNVKFLFYNPSLGHNDYKLLHSTCRGEVNNPAWEVELYSKAPNERIGNTIDATNVQDNFNRNARRYFENN